jgi:methyl-accepting chemotaxis protein
MALNAVGSTAIWRSTSVACTTLTVLMLSMALAWRLVAQCREILDELVLGLERVSMGDLSHRLNESGSAEMRRVASAFNAAAQSSARRAEGLNRSSLQRLQAAIDLRESRELATAI